MWDALVAGELDAVYADRTGAEAFQSAQGGYQRLYFDASPGGGVAFGCHPEYGHLLKALNEGLVAYKVSAAYRNLCNASGHVPCDCNGTIVPSAPAPPPPPPPPALALCQCAPKSQPPF